MSSQTPLVSALPTPIGPQNNGVERRSSGRTRARSSHLASARAALKLALALNGSGGRAASRPCEGSEPSVRGAGLLAGRVVKGFS